MAGIKHVDYRNMDRSHETVKQLYRFFLPSRAFRKRQDKLDYSNKTKSGIIDQLRTYRFMWDLEEFLGLKATDFDNFIIAATFEQEKILVMLSYMLGGSTTDESWARHDAFLKKYGERLKEIQKIAKPITGKEFFKRHGLEKIVEIYKEVFDRTGMDFWDMMKNFGEEYEVGLDILGQTDRYKQRVFESLVGDSIEDVSLVLDYFGLSLEDALNLPWE